ncbi:MAG: Lrp/AsnC family transcriptional regulator [Dehalococcoidia bacterium]
MDELDRRIIGLLQLDGRASNAALAKELGVSEGTIHRRLWRLVQEEAIRIAAVPNLEKIGYGTTALVGVQTRPGEADHVAETLAGLEQVHYSSVTTGAYDVFLWVALGSAERLGEFLRTKVAAVAGVHRTETFVN